MDNLIVNQQDLRTYNDDEIEETSNRDSFGSISSADERDIKLLTMGDHRYYFNAVNRIEEFTAQKMEDNLQAIKSERAEERRIKIARIWQKVTCKNCRGTKESKKFTKSSKLARKMSMTGWENKSGIT